MRIKLLIAGLAALAALAYAQRERLGPPRGTAAWEYRVLLPQEIGPGMYRNVDLHELSYLGDQGWELVSVTPWVIRNDERKYKNEETPRVVTQSYLAYYFKRQKVRAE